MPEPTSTSSLSLAILAVAVFGPMAGPYALIVFSALAGAMWPLLSSSTMTRKAGAWMLFRCTLTAVMLTGSCSLILQQIYRIPANESLGLVAFAIGAVGNGWRAVFADVAGGLGALARRLGGNSGEGP